jgi:flavodoxin/NAD-dependent dihydropyrimidine dehydrogenase PreA subunit
VHWGRAHYYLNYKLKTIQMIKALIATFSQTGSTEKVSEQIAKGLRSAGWEIDHFSIGSNDVPDLKIYDVIGIGSPTYYYRPPFIVRDFIQSLKKLSQTSSFVFILYGTHLGNCGNWIRNQLNVRGSKDLGYFYCAGADYYMPYVKRRHLFSPDSPTEKELSSAEEFGKTVTKRFNEENPEIEPFDSSTPIMYGLERFFANRTFSRLLYSKVFRVDNNCNSCGICIKRCPTNNITEKGKGQPQWHSNCLLCATCELNCPKDAIHSAFDWFIFAPFMNYNINMAKKKSIPYVKVEHSSGKTCRT